MEQGQNQNQNQSQYQYGNQNQYNNKMQQRPPQNNRPIKVKKKDSVLSVIAAVLALFTITAIPGIIVGIIDLCIGKKEQRHLGSWFALIFGALATIVLFSNFSNSVKNAINTNVNQNPTGKLITSGVNDDEVSDTTVAEYKNCKLKYLDFEINGDELVVYFDFTNNSNENKTFIYTFDNTAFQDGIEVSKNYFSSNEYFDNTAKEIQPGTTIKVGVSYKITDPTKPVDLQTQGFLDFNKKILMEHHLDINK